MIAHNPILSDQLVHGQFVIRTFERFFPDYLTMPIKSFDEVIELIREDILSSETHMSVTK